MRRTTLLVSLLMYAGMTAVAACSDQEKATPTAPTVAGNIAAASQSPSMTQATASAKPAPAPVGFTKIQIVSAPLKTVPVGQGTFATAICPAGTTVISGGHIWGIVGNNYVPPFVKSAQIVGNGWQVLSVNVAPGAADAAIIAIAYCAS